MAPISIVECLVDYVRHSEDFVCNFQRILHKPSNTTMAHNQVPQRDTNLKYLKTLSEDQRAALKALMQEPIQGSTLQQLSLSWAQQYLIVLVEQTTFWDYYLQTKHLVDKKIQKALPRPPEAYTWSVTEKGDIQSNFDPFDTLLVVTGDFGSLEKKKEYAALIAKALNQGVTSFTSRIDPD